MKWKNKGHEFDEYAEKLRSEKAYGKYYIFGAGMVGRDLLSTLGSYGCVSAFIDNDPAKQGTVLEGFAIISLDQYLRRRDGLVLIAASQRNTQEIIKQLEAASLRAGTDFSVCEDFMQNIFPVVSVYRYDKSFVRLAQISLTERCTLKCKKCAHGCYAVNNHPAEDLSLQTVLCSADVFFKRVDFIQEFVLIGGEPLLYRDLAQAIHYIGERYRKRIGLFSITTNGTIVPDAEVLRECRQYNMRFFISNYSASLPRFKETQKRLIHALDEAGVLWTLGRAENLWMDYGFEYLNRNATAEGLTEVFDRCGTPCREIRGSRFYYCVMARSISDNLKFHVGAEDFLNLDVLSGENYKKELLEFTMGYSRKGFLDMCNYCHGADAKNYPIPAAEQVGS